jgi:hypothetical protein
MSSAKARIFGSRTVSRLSIINKILFSDNSLRTRLIGSSGPGSNSDNFSNTSTEVEIVSDIRRISVVVSSLFFADTHIMASNS